MTLREKVVLLLLLAILIIVPPVAAGGNWSNVRGSSSGTSGGIAGNFTFFVAPDITLLNGFSGLKINDTTSSASWLTSAGNGYYVQSLFDGVSTAVTLTNGTSTYGTGTIQYRNVSGESWIEILTDAPIDTGADTGRKIITLTYDENAFHLIQPAHYINSPPLGSSNDFVFHDAAGSPYYRYSPQFVYFRIGQNATVPGCMFNWSPASGYEYLIVAMNDTSTNAPTSWAWQLFRAGAGLYLNASRNWTSIPLEAGSWTINLTASNDAGSCSMSVPAAVSIATYTMNASLNATIVNLDVKNSVTGALIQGCQVGIRNMTSGAWRNSTSETGLVYFDSTGPSYEYPLSIGETIDLAATATGYSPQNTTFKIPYDNYRAYLNLVPTSVVNATSKFTLVVSVTDQHHGLPMQGVAITVDSGEMKNTNSAGAAIIYNVSSGLRKITADYYGYQAAEKTITGTAGETHILSFQLVMTGETPVPTMIPVNVTTTGNVTPESLNVKGAAGLSDMLDFIIGLWPLVFVITLMAFMKAAFRWK